MKFLTKSQKKVIPTVYISVGPPASGKTYWWKQGIELGTIPEKLTMYINPDEQAANFLIKEDEVYRLSSEYCLSLLNNSIIVGLPIIYLDGYFITKNSREPIIKIAKKNNYKAVCLHFSVDQEVCLERSPEKKEKIILVNSMIDKEPPSLEEGFDSIWQIKK